MGVYMQVADLKVKLFADGADMITILELYKNPAIKGFTTNPTLMRKAGIKDYESFAKELVEAIPDRPFSFEVFADEFFDMERQARKIASWGENVYVKIPVTNTRGEKSRGLVYALSHSGIKVNVTALTTLNQVDECSNVLAGGEAAYVSVFAGRIADTGVDPVPIMKVAAAVLPSNVELIWASPRELLNVFQADAVGCHIITATSDILKKLPLVGKDLNDYSLETVQMFYRDAQESGFQL
jgi:transaldolase